MFNLKHCDFNSEFIVESRKYSYIYRMLLKSFYCIIATEEFKKKEFCLDFKLYLLYVFFTFNKAFLNNSIFLNLNLIH